MILWGSYVYSTTNTLDTIEGLFVPFADVGSGDPVRVLRLFHNKYTGYNWSIFIAETVYNLSLPNLSATLLVAYIPATQRYVCFYC